MKNFAKFMLGNPYIPVHFHLVWIYAIVKFIWGFNTPWWDELIFTLALLAIGLEGVKAQDLKSFQVDFFTSLGCAVCYLIAYFTVPYFGDPNFLRIVQVGFVDVALFAILSFSQALREVIGFPGGYTGNNE